MPSLDYFLDDWELNVIFSMNGVNVETLSANKDVHVLFALRPTTLNSDDASENHKNNDVYYRIPSGTW